jgi:acetoin:2,6-dichlorophenolindophenol oxidoreductase subunit alpha
MDRRGEFLYRMALIRRVEETLLELYGRGLLRGTVHTCIGQEACAVGVVSALDPTRDILFSNHRGHGHYLAYCGDVHGLLAELMGRPDGVCGGVGGSQHLQRDRFYSNGILGAGMPIAVGMALAEKRRGSGAVAIAFLGDGSFGEGIVYEALNIAALWSAPVVIVVEHNGWAQSSPTHSQHAGSLQTRATTFGIPVTLEDGMDVERVFARASEIAPRVRESSRPEILFLDTCRFAPHSKGDDHRDPALLARERTRDPITRLAGVLGDAAWAETETRVADEVRRIVCDLA